MGIFYFASPGRSKYHCKAQPCNITPTQSEYHCPQGNTTDAVGMVLFLLTFRQNASYA